MTNLLNFLQQKADKALKYYKGCNGSTVTESIALSKELDRITKSTNQQQADKKIFFSDFCK